jgi:uncharacterized membrane protein
MFERLPVLFRSAMYALRGGFLIRPLVIAMVLGTVGAVLSSLEESTPEIGGWIPHTLFPSHEDPGVAQIILSSIATSIMTVVSIVFAILLMTLTLASTRPRAARSACWSAAIRARPVDAVTGLIGHRTRRKKFELAS